MGGRGGRGALGGHGIPAAPRIQALGGGAWPHNATARTSLQLPRGPRSWREGRVAAPGPRGLTTGGHPTARGTARWARVGWEGGVPAGTQGHRQEGLLVPGCHLAQTGGELPGTSTSLQGGRGLRVWPLFPRHRTRDPHTPPGTNSAEGRRCWPGLLDGRAEAPGCPVTALAAAALQVKGADPSPATRLGRDRAALLGLEGTSECCLPTARSGAAAQAGTSWPKGAPRAPRAEGSAAACANPLHEPPRTHGSGPRAGSPEGTPACARTRKGSRVWAPRGTV